MTWSTFFAGPEDFAPLLERMLQFDGARVFEVYSRLGNAARDFSSPFEAVQTFQLGVDPSGNGVAAHCAVWVPAIMATPTRKRIELKTGNWRESIEGCGLFWLQAGGIHHQTITESRLGWFTQGAARQRCTVEPGPDRVNWTEHKTVATELTRTLRALSVARAKRFPILAQAASLHANGYRLLYGLGIKREIAVERPNASK